MERHMDNIQVLDWTPNAILHNAFRHAHQNFREGGTILEFGVGAGNSYCWMAEQMLKRYKSSMLVGFDSWKGLPEETEGVYCPEPHGKGKYCWSKGVVTQKLFKLEITMENRRFNFVDGFYRETLRNHSDNQHIHDIAVNNNVIFVNIDVDIHSSTVEVLEFIAPLVRVGTILYFDDWKDPAFGHDEEKWGEHLAFEQWLERHANIQAKTVEVNDWNQRYMEITAV